MKFKIQLLPLLCPGLFALSAAAMAGTPIAKTTDNSGCMYVCTADLDEDSQTFSYVPPVPPPIPHPKDPSEDPKPHPRLIGEAEDETILLLEAE